ncbi:hypothetical protein I316_02655 [Kwoniella heveanensis BCC8398]|uniref:Uncharacterized protein n=1 Tax=Kwoniella heveanensis BCC8398 TaxID=1296120 RepID=A0A1B9GX57_9TREE|nr:hypothetical protein I316_02655 [Kwoniella heveanensis BCC8398]
MRRSTEGSSLFLTVWTNAVICDNIVSHLSPDRTNRAQLAKLLSVCQTFWQTLVPKLYHTIDLEKDIKIRRFDNEASQRRVGAYYNAVRELDLTIYSRIQHASRWLKVFERFPQATTIFTADDRVIRSFVNGTPHYTLEYHRVVSAEVRLSGLDWVRTASSFGMEQNRINGSIICTTIDFRMGVNSQLRQPLRVEWWDEVVKGLKTEMEQHEAARITGIQFSGFMGDHAPLLDTLRSFDEKGMLAVDYLALDHFDLAAIHIINLCRRTIMCIHFDGSPAVSLDELIRNLRVSDLPRIQLLTIGCLPRTRQDTFNFDEAAATLQPASTLFSLTFVTTCGSDLQAPDDCSAEVEHFQNLPRLLSHMFDGADMGDELRLKRTWGPTSDAQDPVWDDCVSAFDKEACKLFPSYVRTMRKS